MSAPEIARPAPRRWLKLAVIAIIGFVGIAAAVGWRLTAPRPAVAATDAAALETGGDASRGRVVFAAGDCASCHASPGQSDRLRLGGGLALSTPLGVFHVPNISPDPQDGIGRWRTIDLANALLSGVSPDGRHYYPAFPYAAYAHMRLDDVRDLMAYLRTLAPVAGRAPPHELSFPFDIRRGIGLWKAAFLDRSPVRADPTKDAAWNRGHYLVEALAHCDECHSSRNVFFAVKSQTRFAGGVDQDDVGFVPNITPTGIGSWSRQVLVDTLRRGHTPEGLVIGSSMADVVTNYASLPERDQIAIAAYIKSLPPRPTPSP
ncbi:MAG TPA: cytochrome c [Stellaceae bacterium]|nr:cytochrome c [Stellaceae bacterium]